MANEVLLATTDPGLGARAHRIIAEIALGRSMPTAVALLDVDVARVGLHHGGSLELTETERRIAELAAAGLTNREIAAEAFVAPKTVEDVISRIYTKLGIRSRAQLGDDGAGRGGPSVRPAAW